MTQNTNSTEEIDKLELRIETILFDFLGATGNGIILPDEEPAVSEAKRQIQALLTEAYKKGFIDSGVGEIVRTEKARQVVEAELTAQTNTGEVSNE